MRFWSLLLWERFSHSTLNFVCNSWFWGFSYHQGVKEGLILAVLCGKIRFLHQSYQIGFDQFQTKNSWFCQIFSIVPKKLSFMVALMQIEIEIDLEFVRLLWLTVLQLPLNLLENHLCLLVFERNLNSQLPFCLFID